MDLSIQCFSNDLCVRGHRTQEGSSCFPPARLLLTASFYLSSGREPRHASSCLFLLRIPLQGSPGRLPSFVRSTLLRSSESIAETDPHTCGLSVEISGSPCPPTGLASLLPPRPLAPRDRDCTASAWRCNHPSGLRLHESMRFWKQALGLACHCLPRATRGADVYTGASFPPPSFRLSEHLAQIIYLATVAFSGWHCTWFLPLEQEPRVDWWCVPHARREGGTEQVQGGPRSLLGSSSWAAALLPAPCGQTAASALLSRPGVCG